MITVSVRASGGSYQVVVGAGILRRAGELVPPSPGGERIFVVADERVADLFLDRLLRALPLPAVHLLVPEGEEAKTLRTAEALYERLAAGGAHREDTVVALGGGATGDAAGFVAATYMRGVPLVQAPTTLTAQVDAAVGGKVGVNLPHGKNLVGAFYQPRAVLADVETLGPLPEPAFRSGLAEVAKYGFAVDPRVLEMLATSGHAVLSREPGILTELVAACVRAKASVVERDEREAGPRAVLNYGHTLGHALERVGGFRGMSHGEAVASGMVFAARLAEALGIAPPGLAERHRRTLAALGLPTDVPATDPDAVLEAMRVDKKYRHGLRFVLLEEVGRPRVAEVSEEDVRAVLKDATGGAA